MNITKSQGKVVPLPTFVFDGGDVNVSIKKHAVTLGFAQACADLQNKGDAEGLARKLESVIDDWDVTHFPDVIRCLNCETIFDLSEDIPKECENCGSKVLGAPKKLKEEKFPHTWENLKDVCGIEFINLLIESIGSVTGGNEPSPKASENGSQALVSSATPAKTTS